MRSPFAALRALSGRILIALVVCFVVMAAAVVEVNRYIDDEVAKIPRVELNTATEASTGGTNFLIIGSDTRSFVTTPGEVNAFGSASQESGQRSDTMMVLHADGNRSYGVSFPRDLWVDIPGRGQMKLNAAFNNGPQKVIDTLKANFGVDIQHYLEVDFKTFEDIVNAVGSVPVYFPYPARDQLSGLYVPFAPTCARLNGSNALAYVRSRYLEYFENGKWVSASPLADIDRIQRQQSFVKKLGRIAVQQTIDDPTIAPDLADKMIPNLTADRSFDRSAFNQLVLAFLGLADTNGRSGGPAFVTLPWDGPATRDGQSVLLVKQPDAKAVLAVLRGEAPIPAPTTTTAPGSAASRAPTAVRPTDVRVRVLNASGTHGQATDALDALTKLGFVSGGAGNDPRGLIDHSEVRYRPGDEAKARLVASHLPDATLVADASLPGTDVVVALGKSFRGVGSAPATTAPTPAPTTTTVSPEAACN